MANLENVEEFWDLLFNDAIFQIILENTNKKIAEVRAELQAQQKVLQSYHHDTSLIELRALCGVLYYAGLWRSNSIDVNRLWESLQGVTLYTCVFSRQRFVFLSASLRFDDKSARDPNDKFSPVRQIWEIFIGNCQRYYKPSKKFTVDEQLLSFRGRCGFKMYIKSKPDKYGLKLVTLNDAETAYLVNISKYKYYF